MPKPTPITEETKLKILEDYNIGLLNQAEILVKYNIGYIRLHQILKLPNKRSFRVRYDRDEVRKDYREGKTVKEIMAKHKISSVSNVYAIIKNEKKRTRSEKKVWTKTARKTEEPTDPIILRLREKMRNHEQNTKEIGLSGLMGGLEPYLTVQTKRNYQRNNL